jgi:hypothetical protein
MVPIPAALSTRSVQELGPLQAMLQVVPPQRIRFRHELCPMQVISQLLAARQSISPPQPLAPQTTEQGAPVGQVMSWSQLSASRQSKTQVPASLQCPPAL